MSLSHDNVGSYFSGYGLYNDNEASVWSSHGWFIPSEVKQKTTGRLSFVTKPLDDVKKVLDLIELSVDSPFRTTEIYEEAGNRFFDNIALTEIQFDTNDAYIPLNTGEENRIENFAYRVYKNDNLWPLLGIANQISNPFFLDAKVLLRVPDLARIYTEILTKPSNNE